MAGFRGVEPLPPRGAMLTETLTADQRKTLAAIGGESRGHERVFCLVWGIHRDVHVSPLLLLRQGESHRPEHILSTINDIGVLN